MFDVFAREACAFLNGFDALELDDRADFVNFDDSEKAKVRTVIGQAEWFRDQRNSPFADLTLPQLLVIDLGDSFLRWCADRTNNERLAEMFDCRWSIEALDD
ncbi:hypothetical protein A5787_22585 [Mycobacterium sp. 852002-50816_SCH5313054-b]|uniref:hypothetical protein n=1 Tax=Mycobacterium sp. 852002-50816_SCH5313054-b TaxID=1834092 RepID=UPI0007FCC5CB|nr:hypothetical protein [Mycobacterium sp. 852002-50816_SCH5313054-b]OBF58744.1 hypothetical protein A5787_22585 [Mycobacterium sp. 852002-50816_SCH5313054-b]